MPFAVRPASSPLGRCHHDRMRLRVAGPAMTAPSQKATSAMTMSAVATVHRAATLNGRNGTPSRQTHRNNDRPIRMTPAKAQRLLTEFRPVDGGEEVIMRGNSRRD